MAGPKIREPSIDDVEMTVDDLDDADICSESEPESGDEIEARTEPAKNAVYNKEGLLEKLEDIAWPDDVDWVQKLTVDHVQSESVDVNDDLTRELAFYTQALDGTRQAFEKLQSMGVRFLRPPDYYAEMVKSDTHMLKVKGKLLADKKKIEEAEERKKAREAKRIAKEVQAEKNKERAKQKKEEIESVKKWRKQRQQSGFIKGDDDGDEMAFDFESNAASNGKGKNKRQPQAAPGDRFGGRGKLAAGKKGKGMNRDKRNSKFGYGGKKGLRKQNTAESTNDFREFNRGSKTMNKKRKR